MNERSNSDAVSNEIGADNHDYFRDEEEIDIDDFTGSEEDEGLVNDEVEM